MPRRDQTCGESPKRRGITAMCPVQRHRQWPDSTALCFVPITPVVVLGRRPDYSPVFGIIPSGMYSCVAKKMVAAREPRVRLVETFTASKADPTVIRMNDIRRSTRPVPWTSKRAHTPRVPTLWSFQRRKRWRRDKSRRSQKWPRVTVPPFELPSDCAPDRPPRNG